MQQKMAFINQLNEEAFIQHFGSIIEHSDWIAQELYHQRPFSDITALHQAIVKIITHQGPEAWKKILCLHPDLSGKEAKAGTLTHYSAEEQSGIGLNRLTSEQFAYIQTFNRRYREKFDFPFVICVRLLDNLDALFIEQKRRIALSREEELITGIEQVYKIARIRLEDMVASLRV